MTDHEHPDDNRAPETIWTYAGSFKMWRAHQPNDLPKGASNPVEYTRTATIPARIAAAEAAAYRKAADAILSIHGDDASELQLRVGDRLMIFEDEAHVAILALIDQSALDEALAAEREKCAKFIDKRAEEYDREHGMYDSTTGVTEYPGDGEEWMLEWEELATAIRKGDQA